MLQVRKNISLKALNTFHFNVSASEYIETNSVKNIQEWLETEKPDLKDVLVLGGGSNLLFSSDYSGTIIHPLFNDIKIVKEDDDTVLIEAGAGKVWDEFVEFCVNNKYYGIENLSLIPGTVGASPVQNIGAYGMEAGNVIVKVNGLFLDSGKEFSYSNSECNFGYRNSIFKKELKNRVLITSVLFRLSKKEQFDLNYGHLEDKVKEYGELTIANVRKAVISIRNSKLPDPVVTGNAGSFFKNPEIAASMYHNLKAKFPDMPGYPLKNEKVKVPAGWLIDKAGWKGKRSGEAGVHHEQALVLVNLGKATGKDVLELASLIEKDIRDKFGIDLEKEVIII